MKRLREMLLRRDDSPESYRLLCEAHPSPVASVLRAAVLRAGRPLPEVEKAMEDAAAREQGALRARVKVLSVCGNVAPLVGLFGTVVGMIIAFRVASAADTGKLGQLATGIYVALLTTAGGLMIASPSVLAASWFYARIVRFLRDIVDALSDALPSFNRMHEAEERKRETRAEERQRVTSEV
jgi:biopolymer transport protein ExbB